MSGQTNHHLWSPAALSTLFLSIIVSDVPCQDGLWWCWSKKFLSIWMDAQNFLKCLSWNSFCLASLTIESACKAQVRPSGVDLLKLKVFSSFPASVQSPLSAPQFCWRLEVGFCPDTCGSGPPFHYPFYAISSHWRPFFIPALFLYTEPNNSSVMMPKCVILEACWLCRT